MDLKIHEYRRAVHISLAHKGVPPNKNFSGAKALGAKGIGRKSRWAQKASGAISPTSGISSGIRVRNFFRNKGQEFLPDCTSATASSRGCSGNTPQHSSVKFEKVGRVKLKLQYNITGGL